ncbi:MAG TPA: hypothetical protein VFG66_01630 [Gemmatimonadales bacterium]|nr:hypothetical protein [Gemmatimonadales bacterium]
MASEEKPSWWKSVPGILTAATGFVAALSGLVAGLNQLGAFRRPEPAPQVVATAPAPPESTSEEPATPEAEKPAPSTARPPAPATAPKPRTGTAPSPAATTDSAAAAPRQLPKGTALELTVPARACAPAKGARRVAARLAAPVTVNGDTLLPASTTAVLRVQRSGSRAPQVRLDSLVGRGIALAVSRSDVRLRGDAVDGSCLRARARMTVTLSAAVPLRRR